MRRRSALLAALIAATLPTLLAPEATGPAQASPPREERAVARDTPAPAASGRAGGPIDLAGLDFQLISAAGGWCLTAGMTQLPCATSAPYRWRFRPVDVTGMVEILHVRTGTCLTMPGGTFIDGARAGLGPCGAPPSRRWHLRDSLGQTAKVVNVRSGKCLAIESGVAVQGACAGTDGSRRWTLRALSAPRLGAARR